MTRLVNEMVPNEEGLSSVLADEGRRLSDELEGAPHQCAQGRHAEDGERG
jgi:hypothetical protein